MIDKLKYIVSLSILAVITVIVLTLCRLYLSEDLSKQENLVKHLITEHSKNENSFSLGFLFETKSTSDIVYLSQFEDSDPVSHQTEIQASILTKQNSDYAFSIQNNFPNEPFSMISLGFTAPLVKPPSS